MIPRSNIGKGVSGAVRYALSEGNDRKTNRPLTAPKGEHSRVLWVGGTGFGFAIEDRGDVDLARRIMEFASLNQTSKTKKCINDCVHLSLGWREGENPTREQMEAAAHQALASIGMGNARALFFAHGDEPYAHLHIVASKINPETGKAYDLKRNWLRLSKWAESYEREFSNGVVVTRREGMNQLREAIDRRDPTAVLELMTQQRATFRASDLERQLSKQITSAFDRAQFAEKVLGNIETVRLADKNGDVPTRYTTRAVLEAEYQVLRAADALAGDGTHGVKLSARMSVLTAEDFNRASHEQQQAVRRVIEPGGLALIDGQAGTGKSFTIDIIRQVFEADGRHVIGLAPTNAVASDMRGSGFTHASTLHSELFKLNTGRTRWNRDTVVILDEAAMVDTKLMAELTNRAQQAGAKLIMVGDDRQLSSIDRGGMFGVLKDKYGAAELSTVRRQTKEDDRRAAELMAEGNFSAALGMYEQKGAIQWTGTQRMARELLVDQWAKDSAADPSKSRFVFAYTNNDVSKLNADIRAVRKERGELPGPDHKFQTKHGEAEFTERDRIQFTGTDKKVGLENGAAGTIEKIDGATISVRLDGRAPKLVEFDASAFQDFRHGYAGTIYKGQGRTLDQTYLYHSEHWRSAASYVALTRHRDTAQMFVARETARNVDQLARQMARVDDRRAASHFHALNPPGGPKTAAQAVLAPDGTSLAPRPEKPRVRVLAQTAPHSERASAPDLTAPPAQQPEVRATQPAAEETPQPAKRPKPPAPKWTSQGGMAPQQRSANKTLKRAKAKAERAQPFPPKTPAAAPPIVAPLAIQRPAQAPAAIPPAGTPAPVQTPAKPIEHRPAASAAPVASIVTYQPGGPVYPFGPSVGFAATPTPVPAPAQRPAANQQKAAQQPATGQQQGIPQPSQQQGRPQPSQPTAAPGPAQQPATHRWSERPVPGAASPAGDRRVSADEIFGQRGTAGMTDAMRRQQERDGTQTNSRVSTPATPATPARNGNQPAETMPKSLTEAQRAAALRMLESTADADERRRNQDQDRSHGRGGRGGRGRSR